MRCFRKAGQGGITSRLSMQTRSPTVPDAQDQDPNAVALRALNLKMAHDTRVRASLLPVTDGVMLAVKI